MIVIKDQKYQSVKPEDLKSGDSIIVITSELTGFSYTQTQVAELMNKAYNAGYARCNVDNGDDH